MSEAAAKKIELQVRPPRRDEWWERQHTSAMSITRSLPFYVSAKATRVHRVRRGSIHKITGRSPHTALEMWCGQHMFLKSPQSHLSETVPDYLPLCAVCEGRAIGAGELDGGTINGRPVLFTPRRKSHKEPNP